MGLTLIFSELQVIVSSGGKVERKKKENGRKEKGVEKERKEGRKME